MGIFDFFKKNKNIENDNGFNKIYKDSGIQEFYKIDGKFNGEFKQYNNEGTLIIHIQSILENSNGEIIQSGKEIKRFKNGSIFSEVNFKKGLRNGFGISYDEKGNIEKIDYYKNDEDVTWDNDKNKRMMLKEIKKYMNDGVNVYPVQYLGLCESLGINSTKFKDDSNLKI